MWALDTRKYDIIHLKNSKIQPWIVNPEAMNELQRLTDFILEIKKILSEGYLHDTYDALQAIYAKPRGKIKYTHGQVLSALGMVTYSQPPKPFLDHTEFNEFKKETSCILFSEKNLIPQHVGRGSSRHALGNNFQFKGIGRNSMAHLEDYYHSWGGYVTRDALRSLLCDKMISERTQLGCVRTQAVFKYEEQFLEKTPLVLALRENDCYRLSQINPGFLNNNEKEILLNSLEKRFHTNDLKLILNTIIDHYVHAFSIGIIHRSISQENLTLDGRFIDTDSIEYSESLEPCPYYIKLGSKTHDRTVLSENATLLIEQDSNVPFYRTWLHDLMLASELTSNAFRDISGKNFDWQQMCLSACETYLKSDYRSWVPLLEHESYSRKFMLSNDLPIGELKWSTNLHKLTNGYVCTGSFYDLNTHLLMNTFSAKSDEVRNQNMVSLMKYDLALWSKPCTWEDAFENWKLINRREKE